MIKLMRSHYKQMHKIYFNIFEEEFVSQSRYVAGLLKEILNTKIFYLDRIVWIEAYKSKAIWRTFEMLHIEKNINSQIYLTHRLSVALPYTQDYQYLKKCLRIYHD
ncbi:MAG: hypothetical protein JJW00_06845 [Sulfurimonas sp.]|nr:hypothetical protein [Sulfurimonas sp.]